jgi:MFS family permease
MLALGLTDSEIGLIISVSWGFQIIMALLSGAITDKLGRRRTTLIFDILAWGVPALIWAVAQNFWYFLLAGIINSIWRITMNSWSCLLVEDADPDQLVDIYTWIHIANVMVGFVAPLTGFLIATFSLIPTMRGLYFFAAIMFTLKSVVTYLMTEETRQGKVRMAETRGQSLFGVLREYRGVFVGLLQAPQTLFTAGILLVIAITGMISGTFWAIIVTEELNIPAEHLAFFPFLKSAIMLVFFFGIMPRLNRFHFKMPMVLGFAAYFLSQLLLVTAPEQGYAVLVVSVFLEACGYAAISPLVDKMVVLTIDPQERARTQSIIAMGTILLTTPFGWIAGTLSGIDRNLPFYLNIALFAVGAILAWLAGNYSQRAIANEPAAA